MRVDVVDRVRLDAGIGEGLAHGARRAVHVGRDGILGIRRGAVAGKLGQDGRAALARMLLGFEDDHRTAGAEHHAVAVLREGAAEVGRHHPQRLPGVHRIVGDAMLGAADERDVDDAGPDHLQTGANGLGGGGTGRGDRERRPLQAIAHRQVGGARRGDQLGHHQRVRPALLDEGEMDALLDRDHAADAGADEGRRARPEPRLAVIAGLGHRLVGGDEHVLADRIAEWQDVLGEIERRLEVLDLGGDLDAAAVLVGKHRGRDARAPVAGGGPQLVRADAGSRHGAHARDDHPLPIGHQACCFSLMM